MSRPQLWNTCGPRMERSSTMSHSLAHTINVWEAVLAQLRRKSVSWKGISLSDQDNNTFTEAIVMCCCLLTDITSRHDGPPRDRDFITWAHFVCTLDVSDFSAALSDCCQLCRCIYKPTTVNWFKRQLSNKYPFIGDLIAPIRPELELFLQTPDPRGFRIVYQFFSFLTHLSLDIPVDLETEYEELEERMSNWEYPSDILDSLNNLAKEWLKDFSVSEENFFPSHGDGATAETSRRCSGLSKYQYLGTDPLISYCFRKFASVDIETYFPLPFNQVNRESIFVSVPKSMKTRRGISKEPAGLMYLQQGIWKILKAYIEEHSYLGQRLNFSDQQYSAILAIRSSRTGAFATIDLSSASDTVTISLVKAVFRNTPLYPFLVSLRSRTVRLPSGKCLVVEKYAPMGSALCFPVESLIFSLVAEYVARRDSTTDTPHGYQWRVYGDDIIIPDRLFRETITVLTSLGFIPNESKSFSFPFRFRESCGGEGYDGVDVTPMKISRRFYSLRGRITSRHAALYAGLIDMANAAYQYNLPILRAFILRIILGNEVGSPLFSGRADFALFSPWPDNYQARHKYNRKTPYKGSFCQYQRCEIRVVQAVAVPREGTAPKGEENFSSTDGEQARLFDTLRLASDPFSGRKTDDMYHPDHLLSVSSRPTMVKLKERWVERPPFFEPPSTTKIPW